MKNFSRLSKFNALFDFKHTVYKISIPELGLKESFYNPLQWIVNVIFIILFSYSIYAIGDVIEGPMLAHKAEDEGLYEKRWRGIDV